MYVRCVDPSPLTFSFSSHRHSYISFCLAPVFSINNKRKKVNLDVEIVTVWPHLPRPQFLTHTWTQVNRLSESHQQSFYEHVRETDVCKCVWHSVSFTPSPLLSPLTTSPDQSSVWEDSIFSNFRSSSFITPTTSSSSPLSRHFIRYNKKQGTPHRTGVFWGRHTTATSLPVYLIHTFRPYVYHDIYFCQFFCLQDCHGDNWYRYWPIIYNTEE